MNAPGTLLSASPETGEDPALDGVRGWAAAMVFWSHSAGNHVWGGSGVWLFFILSGFLLFRPFVAERYRFSRRQLLGYGLRRLLRIWPLLLVAIPVYAAFVPALGGWPNALPHALLAKADLHFWTVKQELLFYLLLPMFAALCALKPDNALWILIGAAAAGYALFDIAQIISIPWQGIGLKFRVVPFILGMAIAAGISRAPADAGKPLFRIGVAGVVVLSSSTLYHALNWRPGPFEWEHPYVLWPFLIALIIGAYRAPNRLVTHPFIRQIGKWGYGIYLWHFGAILSIKAVIGHNPWLSTILAGVVTLALAAISYRFVEAPAIAAGKRFSRILAEVRLLPGRSDSQPGA